MHRCLLIVAIWAMAPATMAQTASFSGWNGPLGMLGRYDANQNNQLTSEEYVAGLQTGFIRTDSNGDGRLSFKELDSLKNGTLTDSVKARIAELKACDSDGDKKLSHDEYDACSAAKFREIDTSGDGIVTPDEADVFLARG